MHSLPLSLSQNSTHLSSGNFSDDISTNATWTSFVRYGNSSENETWTQPFCRMISGIDQPDPDREQECPPEAGWALLTMEGWVWEMFIVPVSHFFLKVVDWPIRNSAVVRGVECVWNRSDVRTVRWSFRTGKLIKSMQGDYYFKFNAMNGDGRRIYCLETNIRLVYKDDDGGAQEL